MTDDGCVRRFPIPFSRNPGARKYIQHFMKHARSQSVVTKKAKAALKKLEALWPGRHASHGIHDDH